MSRRNLVAIAVVLVAALAVSWLVCRDRGGATDDAGARAPSPTDKLRNRPLRTRWANPVCAPTGLVKLPDGTPARAATVVLHAAPLSKLAFEAGDTPDAQTAADGRYTLPPTATGAWILVAALAGHRAGIRHVTIGGASDCASLDLQLGSGGHAVTGIVTDVSGGPVREALVVVRPAAAPTGPPIGLASTRGDGRYELAVEAGDYAITVRHPQYVGFDGLVSVRGPTTFDAVLTPGAELRGSVLARDDRRPIPGARVLVFGGRASGAMGGRLREVVADEDGRFAVTGLGSGRVDIRAVGPNHATREPVRLALGIAESRDDVEILVDPARRIRGVVTHEGKPAADALVRGLFASADASGEIMLQELAGTTMVVGAETDADGVFEIWGLVPGIYDISASGPHSLPSPHASVDVSTADVDNVALELGHGITIRGRVEPPQIATVSLGGIATSEFSDRWASEAEVKSAADGTFELHGAEAGETTIYAYTEAAAGETTVDVPATGATGVVVKLASKGVTVAGRVVDTNGRPVPNAYVAGWSAVTGTDGSFSASGIEPGQYPLMVTVADDTLAVLAPKLADDTIVVPAGGLADLAITVEPRDRTLRGTVVGPDGKPARDTWVVAEPSLADATVPPDLSFAAFAWSTSSRVALTDEHGRFAIGGLAVRTYDVAAEGNKGTERGMTRAATPDRPVRVQLVALGSITVAVTRDGKPVDRYELAQTGPEPDHRNVKSPDGRVTLTGLPPGEYTYVATTSEGAASGTITVGAGTPTLTLALRRWATVTGQVVDKTTGAPLAGIFAFIDNAKADVDTMSWVTDERGRFTIANVPVGAGTVHIMVFGNAEASMPEVPFTTTEGATVDVGVIRVDPPPPQPPDLPLPEPEPEP